MHLELVVLSGPVLLVVIDLQDAVEPQFRRAVRVGLELIVARHRRHDGAVEAANGRCRGLDVDERALGHRRERRDVAELRRRCVVPQDAVAAIRHEHRDLDDRVALPEIEVVSLDIEFAFLPLTESEERLAVVRLPELLHVEGLLPLHLGWHNFVAIGRFGEDDVAGRVGERHGSRGA